MNQLEHSASVTQKVKLPSFVLPKRCDRDVQIEQLLRLPAVTGVDQAPDLACAIIAVEVDSIPLRQGAAVDVSPGHRAAPCRMAIFRHRIDHPSRSTAFIV